MAAASSDFVKHCERRAHAFETVVVVMIQLCCKFWIVQRFLEAGYYRFVVVIIMHIMKMISHQHRSWLTKMLFSDFYQYVKPN